MFGGIVEAVGYIKSITTQGLSKHFIIRCPHTLNDFKIGDSIAVNGVCLTITDFTEDTFHVTAVPETLKLTTLTLLKPNDPVNLERAITPTTRVGGHYVQGHIDTTAEIISINIVSDNAWLVEFKLSHSCLNYIVKKGFIAIDGMSITIVDKTNSSFTVTFIPHTIEHSITKHYQVGTFVNIECDPLGKYIEQFIGAYLDEKQPAAR